ncbi:MAG: hypothetical protein RIS44_2382 [Pseudomonadota bacterium]|jgi:hypothetical protein
MPTRLSPLRPKSVFGEIFAALSAWRNRTLVVVLAMGIAIAAHAMPLADQQLPLSTNEMRDALQEIEFVQGMDKYKVNSYAVRAATPQRIQRLFSTSQVLSMNVYLRESALIFAGQGPLLSFEKPSDVLDKVSTWFARPGRPAGGQEAGRQFHLPRLYGPFARWEGEPAAFVSLWNCMPEEAWVQPNTDPFAIGEMDQVILRPGFLQSIQGRDKTFGQCVRELGIARARSSDTPAQSPAIKAEWRRSSDRGVVVLSDKFSKFLTKHGCEGTGPNDCLMVLHLWASLSPEDPRLAVALQKLDPEKVLRSASIAARAQPGKKRYDTLGVRQAVLFRAKLSSVIHARQAWPAQTLPTLLRQMTPQLNDPVNDIDQISAWALLREHVGRRDWVRAAVLTEIDQIGDNDQGCKTHAAWFDLDRPRLAAAYALHRLQQTPDRGYQRCGDTDWYKLKTDNSADTVKQRQAALAVLSNTRLGHTRDAILSGLSDNGADCFAPRTAETPAWQTAMCRRWVHEPQSTPLTLKNSRLTLDKARQFQKLRFDRPADPESGKTKVNQADWLVASVTPGMHADAVKKIKALATDLRRQNASIRSVTQWRHPGHSRSLLQIEFEDHRQPRIHVLLTPHSLQHIHVPSRFNGDERRERQIARVSDLDADGNLELWRAESFDTCKADDSDLQREVDCTAKSADMGEIGGNVLSYFVHDRRPALDADSDENWTSQGQTHPFSRSALAHDGLEPRCNVKRVSFLSEALGISFGGDSRNDAGAVVALDCKPHPTRPDQTIVALFHGWGLSSGFALAVVDVKREKVLRTYRREMEEDGSIRLSGGLTLDTAAYQVSSKARAFGVRMHTGYSPRYAEGGESDYLSLFVEEGRSLRPVLSNRAMYQWRLLGTDCWRDSDVPCKTETTTTTLSISPSSTNGWQDLDVVATTRDDDASKPKVTRLVGKLRYKNGRYR